MFQTLGFDGKKLKYVAKKLKPARGLKGNLFGGKLLVVQDLATLRQTGKEVILVTSGAVASGMSRLGMTTRPKTIPGTHAAAAVAGVTRGCWRSPACGKNGVHRRMRSCAPAPLSPSSPMS